MHGKLYIQNDWCVYTCKQRTTYSAVPTIDRTIFFKHFFYFHATPKKTIRLLYIFEMRLIIEIRFKMYAPRSFKHKVLYKIVYLSVYLYVFLNEISYNFISHARRSQYNIEFKRLCINQNRTCTRTHNKRHTQFARQICKDLLGSSGDWCPLGKYIYMIVVFYSSRNHRRVYYKVHRYQCE